MKKLVCEICGSHQIEKQGDRFVCGICGCSYSAEQVRSLLVDIPDAAPAAAPTAAPVTAAVSTPQPTTNSELENLYLLARRAREQNNFENAARYYDQIAMRDVNNWEANFFQVYYQSASCRIADIQNAANRIVNCQATTMELIARYVPKDQQLAAVLTVQKYTAAIAKNFFDNAENFYNNIDSSIRYQHIQEAYGRMAAACDCNIFCGNAILQHFKSDKPIMKIAASAWHEGTTLCTRLICYTNNKQPVSQLIHEYDQLRLEHDEDLQKKRAADAKKADHRELQDIKKEIAALERLRADGARNRGFRTTMFLLAALSCVPFLIAFAYCSSNFIPLGMIACFILAIVFPCLLVKAGMARPVPPRDVDDQIRRLILRKNRLERKEENQ